MLSSESPEIPQQAVERLAALLLERAGLKITPDYFYGLRLALASRMPVVGIEDANEYVRRIQLPGGEDELRSLLPLVTVGKTDFFRDARQFQALQAKLLPQMLAQASQEARKVRVWSAGCATGEEPYSLAMVASELFASPAAIDILATDLNDAAVASAQKGRFLSRRMGGVSPERVRRFFRPVEKDLFEVSEELLRYIRFESQNLASSAFPHVVPGTLDLILCRNVIIYFDLPTIRALMDRFFETLRPGGVLLLGYSESLFRVYDRFEMFEVEGSYAYRRPLSTAAPAAAFPRIGAFTDSGTFRAVTTPAPAPKPPIPSPRLPPFSTPALPPSMPSPAISRGKSPVDRLAQVARHMDRGEFTQALLSAEALVADHPTELEAHLTLGNIRSLMGKNTEARDAFAAALALEPLCVEARVFGGIAALQSGQLEEARQELARALFLEPALAIGHYLIAQVHERQGEHEAARRAYRNAILQLARPQRPLAGHYPELPESIEAMGRAARYALAALSEQ